MLTCLVMTTIGSSIRTVAATASLVVVTAGVGGLRTGSSHVVWLFSLLMMSEPLHFHWTIV